jgi:hypothetical protein
MKFRKRFLSFCCFCNFVFFCLCFILGDFEGSGKLRGVLGICLVRVGGSGGLQGVFFWDSLNYCIFKVFGDFGNFPFPPFSLPRPKHGPQ